MTTPTVFFSLSIPCIILILRTSSAQQSESLQSNPFNPYWHREILDPRGKYLLEWVVDWKQERVNFNVTVATRGYVALGLTRNGKMEGADIVMGGVGPKGRIYFSDRHAIGNQQPVLDKQQDWKLHSAWENSTHTFLSFSRPFDTCDEQDVPINDDALYVIWAYGERDNLTEYHFQNRGAFPTYLRDPDLTPRSIHDSNQQWKNPGVNNQTFTVVETVGDAKRWAVRERFHIPAKPTTYWCTVKKFTRPASAKHHMIGYNVRINSEAIGNMHHMFMSRCTPPPGVNPTLLYEPFVDQAGEECYNLLQPLGRMPTMFCTDLFVGHAIGGNPSFFPEHLGVPLGQSDTEYYVLQVHYDNPTNRSTIDSDIEIDIYYTPNLRENEGGTLSVGHHIPSSPSLLVPPGEIEHKIYGHCSPSCTRKMLPPQGIKVVRGMLHSHTAGRGIKVHHFRNGKELPWLLKDDNYKFQFQTSRLLRNEVTVLPGDHLSVVCNYDTSTRNKTTVGGYSTDQEMCQAFLLYYSKLEEYPVCRSEIASREYMTRYLAGTTNITWDQSRLEYMATLPPNVAGRTVSNISDSLVNWDIPLRNQLQRDHILHPQLTLCPSLREVMIGVTLGIAPTPGFTTFPVEIQEYQLPQRCGL